MNNNEWILPEERLPKDGDEVLVTIAEGTECGPGIATRNIVHQACFIEDPHSWCESKYFCLWDAEGTRLTKEVLAWMPLPAPFEAGD